MSPEEEILKQENISNRVFEPDSENHALSSESCRIHLEDIGSVYKVEPGKFQILAISAGIGKGWDFSEGVLKQSLPLWDNAACFIDHGSFWSNRSIKDLAGVLSEPTWSEEQKGVMLTLTANGPAGELLDAIGREILRPNGPKPNVGFSADVWFTSANRKVM